LIVEMLHEFVVFTIRFGSEMRRTCILVLESSTTAVFSCAPCTENKCSALCRCRRTQACLCNRESSRSATNNQVHLCSNQKVYSFSIVGSSSCNKSTSPVAM
jgi:hypothetical protein